MNTLLSDVITNTTRENQNDKTVWIDNTDDFLEIAQCYKTEPSKSNPQTIQERFYFGMFRELLRQLKFYYEQVKRLKVSKDSDSRSCYFSRRLLEILSSIEESYLVTRTYYWELIESKTSSDVETAMFAVSCIARDCDSQKDSSLLFETFASSPSEKLSLFASAFKHSISKDINKKLQQVMNASNRLEIIESCKTILKFRENLERF